MLALSRADAAGRTLPDWHETAREIDGEAGTSPAALRQRSVRVDGLARLVRSGTELTVVWSVSEQEQQLFAGATCNSDANAATLVRLARTLGRPVPASGGPMAPGSGRRSDVAAALSRAPSFGPKP